MIVENLPRTATEVTVLSKIGSNRLAIWNNFTPVLIIGINARRIGAKPVMIAVRDGLQPGLGQLAFVKQTDRFEERVKFGVTA